MLNKKDPLIDAIQQVMQSNQADRDAVKAVNEKFGIQDRRVLPHERQGEWDAAYQTVLTEGVEALDEKVNMTKKQFANLDGKPGFTGADLAHARAGTHKKKAVAGELEEAEKKMKGDDPCWDTHKMVGMKKGKGGKPVPNCVPVKEQDYSATQPSKMGLKPDYATGTPDYAKSKEQTPNRADKTSLPAGTMKEEEQIDEAGMIAKKGTIRRFLTKRSAEKKARSAENKAWPKDSGISPPQDFQKNVATMQRMTKVAKRLGEENRIDEGSMKDTMGEFKRGKLHSGSKAGPIVKSRDQAIAIGMNNEETVNRTGKGNLQEPQTVASGKNSISPEATSKNNNAPGPSFERTGRGLAPSAPQARTNPGISALNRPAPTPARNSPEGGSRPPVASAPTPQAGPNRGLGPKPAAPGSAPTPQAGPNRGLGPKPAAPGSAPVKAPVTTAKPADGANAAKPAQKLKPVRKQPNTGTVKRPGVPARPVTKGSVLDRVKRDRMRNKNNEVGPGN